MKNRPVLSIAPYYGGKGRMAHFLADRLNYDDTDIFVTPFGGMCRELLNKPRHSVECYNDFSSGLTALMQILSNPDRATEFIHRLEDETDHSQETFDKYKAIFDNAETDLEEQEKEKLRRFLIDKKIISSASSNKLLKELIAQVFNDLFEEADDNGLAEEVDNGNSVEEVSYFIKTAFVKLKQRLRGDTNFRDEFQKLFDNWIQLYQLKEKQGFIERSADMGEYVTDMDLAIATYVVFQQSRDGMGKVWSKEKFKTNAQYRKQIVKLFDCAERLEGVQVFQIDAVDFFREFAFVDENIPDEEIDPDFLILNSWINNPRVMMYCDPSYIGVENEAMLLRGVDVDSAECLCDAIMAVNNGKLPKNLGEIYAKSFGYDDQEKFLRCIQQARCRIMVSNYDLVLYNKYLNEDTGWRREIFETTTGVGSKKDNKRTEVIWYNY